MIASKTTMEKEYIKKFLRNEDLSNFVKNKGTFLASTIFVGVIFLIISIWHSTSLDIRVIAIITTLCCIGTVISTIIFGKYLYCARLLGAIMFYGVLLSLEYMIMTLNDLNYLMNKVYIGAGILFAVMLIIYIAKGLYIKTGLKENNNAKKHGASTWLPLGMASGGIGYYIANSTNKEQQEFAIIFTIIMLFLFIVFSYIIIENFTRFYLVFKYDMDDMIREKIESYKKEYDQKRIANK